MSIVRTASTSEQTAFRVAFCGSMGSGKTYASRQTQSLKDVKIYSIAQPIKEITLKMKSGGRGNNIMVGTVGRSIQENVWVDQLLGKLDGDAIVDDVRFENEARILRENGFIIVYLDTPWHVRFGRILERCDNLSTHIQYFNDPSEVAPGQIDPRYFDFICKTEEEVDKIIKQITL
jgi:dephospho-CoA kinase